MQLLTDCLFVLEARTHRSDTVIGSVQVVNAVAFVSNRRWPWQSFGLHGRGAFISNLVLLVGICGRRGV